MVAKFSTFLTAFFVGVSSWAVASYLISIADVPESEPELTYPMRDHMHITACDLGESTGKFVGQTVVLEATVYAVGSKVIIYPTSFCDSRYDPFVNSYVDFTGYSGRNKEISYLLTRDGKPFSEVDVRIRGSVSRAPTNADLWYFTVSPSDIEMITPWRKFEPKGAA